MGIFSEKFIYDKKHCGIYNLMMCSFDGSSGTQNVTGGASIEFTTVKTSGSSQWRITNRQLKEQLEFKFQICKVDASEFTDVEKRTIHRWLVREDDYKELQFDSYSDSALLFYATGTAIDWITVGGRYVGAEISWICRDPWALTPVKTKTVEVVDDTFTTSILNMSDSNQTVYPTIVIECGQSGTFTITNDFDGSITTIANCATDEIITIDSRKREISSFRQGEEVPQHDTIFDDFNYCFPRLCRNYENNINRITLSPNGIFKFSWQEVRKVGV